MLFYFKACLPAVSDAGRGGDHWVSPPPPARPLRCVCACVNSLFYPHVTFRPLPPALPPSPKSLIDKFACFLYPQMWRIWSKACLRSLAGFLSPSPSIRARYFFFYFIFFFLLYLRLPWQLLHVWQKAYGEEKGLSAQLADVQCNHAAAPK